MKQTYHMLKKTIRFCKESSFVEKLIYLYIVILPFSSNYSLLFINKRIQPSDLLFLLIFTVWSWHKLKQKWSNRSSQENRTYLFVIIFLFVTLGSFVNSINWFHSICDWFGLLHLVILFFILTDVINTEIKLRRILIAYSSVSAFVALVGLGAFIQYLITRNPNVNSFLFYYSVESSVLFFPRIKSFFYTPNMFASFEHIGIATFLGLFFLIKNGEKASNSRYLLLIAIFFLTVSIFLAGSQVFAGVLLTIFLSLWLFGGKIMTAIRYVTFLLTVIVLIFAICATIWMIYPLKIGSVTQNRITNINLQINRAYSHHIIPSIYAISMFKKHPLLGVGIGTFSDQYPEYINLDIERWSGVRMKVPLDRVLDPHNTYSGALAEWGALGFIAMSIMFFQFIRLLTICNKPAYGLLSDGLRFSLLACFVGIVLNAIFIDIIMMRHLWVFLAIVFILFKIRMKEYAG